MRRGLLAAVIAASAGAAATGAAVAADQRVRAERRPARDRLDRFCPPEPRRAGYLRADDGVQLYYQLDGPDDAAAGVVLVHGFCQNHDDLLFQRRALLDEFGDRLRIVSYDLRGHGRSTRGAAHRSTIDQLGADLRCVIDALVPAGPVTLVGHSMGGMTVLALADAHPGLVADRVAGVGLISTSTGKVAALTLGVPAGLAQLGDPALRLLLRGMRSRAAPFERGRARLTDAAWVFVRHLAFGPEVDPALVEYVARMIAATPVDVIAEFYPTLVEHDKLAALDVLREVPVAIVCGEHDLLTPPDHSAAMADRLAAAELVLVPGTGHQALMERPEVVNPPLLRLVDDMLAVSA